MERRKLESVVYEPPRVTQLGTFAELTQAPALPGVTDVAAFFAAVPGSAPSDRALKCALRPVSARRVLAGVLDV